MAKLTRNIKSALYRLAEEAGALERLQAAGQKPCYLYVLYYHRVADPGDQPWLDPDLISTSPRQFDAQMQLLRQKYHPVSAADILESLDTGKALPAGAVLVTIDDGYRDFQETIFPILNRHHIQPVLFVPTDYVGGGKSFWWDRLHWAVTATDRQELSTPFGRFDLRAERQRPRVFLKLKEALRARPYADLLEQVAAIEDEAGVQPRDASGSVLSWDELRALARAGVTVAPHTASHPLLSRVPLTQVQAELHQSRTLVEAEIGQPIPVFAFPDGKAETFTPEILQLCQDEGYKLVFSTVEGSGILTPERARCFPRLGILPSLSLASFHFRLTPAYSRLKGYPPALP